MQLPTDVDLQHWRHSRKAVKYEMLWFSVACMRVAWAVTCIALSINKTISHLQK